jgi:hypothetical protein
MYTPSGAILFRNNAGGSLAGIETALSDKTRNYGREDSTDVPMPVTRRDPFIGQPLEHMDRGRPAICESRDDCLTGSQILVGRNKTGVPIPLTDATAAQIGPVLRAQLAVTQRLSPASRVIDGEGLRKSRFCNRCPAFHSFLPNSIDDMAPAFPN